VVNENVDKFCRGRTQERGSTQCKLRSVSAAKGGAACQTHGAKQGTSGSFRTHDLHLEGAVEHYFRVARVEEQGLALCRPAGGGTATSRGRVLAKRAD